MWDMASRTLAGMLRRHMAAVRAMALMASDTQLLAGSDDRSATLWDVRQERCSATFRWARARGS